MKYVKLMHITSMTPIETYEGEYIEEKVARVVENKEPIEDGAPIIYTERKNGVLHSNSYTPVANINDGRRN